MGVLIRSQGGQRSCTLLSNKNKKEPEKDLRQEIIEALKGLTINIELKIADVIEASLSVSGDSSDQPEPSDQPTSSHNDVFSHKATSEAMTNISDKLAAASLDDYRPPRSSTMSQSESRKPALQDAMKEPIIDDSLSRSLGTFEKTAPNQSQAPKQFSNISFAPTQALRKRPTDSTLAGSSGAASTIATESKEHQPEQTTTSISRELSPRSARIEKMRQIKAKIDKEPIPVEKSKLRRGKLEVGKTVQTILACQEANATFVAHNEDDILSITEKLNELTPEFELQPSIRKVQVDDIVVAKSSNDGAWYRGVVNQVDGNTAKVNFFDWGVSEALEITDIRELTTPELCITKVPACAVKVTILNAEQAPDDSEFKIRVESYDEYEDTYQVTLL